MSQGNARDGPADVDDERELSRSRRKKAVTGGELTEESLAALRERLARFARRAQTRPHRAPAEVEHLGQGSVSGAKYASFT